MDRRNGGDHQAPPRPPKLLPRIHRARAPDPMETLNDISSLSSRSDKRDELSIGGNGSGNSGITLTATQRCANSGSHHHHQQQQQQQPQQQQQQQHLNAITEVSNQQFEKIEQQREQQLNSITTASTTIRTASTLTSPTTPTPILASTAISPSSPPSSTTIAAKATATVTAPKTLPLNENPLACISSNTNATTPIAISNSSRNTTSKNISNITESNGINSPGTFIIHNNLFNDPNLLTTCPDYENYQIYHLTYLPQRPSNLTVNPFNSSPSSAITAANSFTRRRPEPQGTVGTPALDARASWRSTGGNNQTPATTTTPTTTNTINSISSSFGSFFSHFHNADNTSASPVTLAQPRPESQRLTNEYVDTPLRTTNQHHQHQHQHPHQQQFHHQHLQNASRTQHPAGQQDNNQTTTHHVLLLPQRATELTGRTAITTTPLTAHSTPTGIDGTDGFVHSQNSKAPTSLTSVGGCGDKKSCHTTPSSLPRDLIVTANVGHLNQLTTTTAVPTVATVTTMPITPTTPPPITKQPASTKCKTASGDDIVPSMQMANASPNSSPISTPIIIAGNLGSTNSITCPRCGLCRCEQCKSSGLPQKWLCKKSCLCSAESIMDYATCLCCAKAIFYHCATQGDMDDEDDYVDDPCSCTSRKRLQRWGWLGALSLVLPCLWCYWPMRGCTWLCEKCYNRFAGRGCRCQNQNSNLTTSNMLPIMPLSSSHGGSGGGDNSSDANSNMQGANNSGSNQNTKSKGSNLHGHHYHHQHHQYHHHHHHHHHSDSMASRMLRKGDITPEKRLLDTNMDY